jgi:hypothetical protein
MKETELRECAICKLCGKKIGQTGLPLFWRVRTEHWGVKIDALQRQQGLTMMLGGHAALAGVMGLDEDMAEKISSTEITVCEECCTKQVWVVMLAEE